MSRFVRCCACQRLIALATLCLLMIAGCQGKTADPGTEASGKISTGAGAAATDGEGKRIVILTNGDDPFWDACEAGAMAAEKELNLADTGLSVSFQRADFTVKGQVDKLKQYGLQDDIVALGISVYDPGSRAIANEMKTLQEKGIHVVTIDGDIDREKYRDVRHAYLGTDNIIGGRELGRAAKALNPRAIYAQFVGSKSAANAIARMDGFNEGIGDQATEVERIEDGGDRPTARKNVKDALDRVPEINMLTGIWAYNTPQAVAEVKDRGIRDKTHVVCFDAAEASIREMEAGNVDVMVVQNPFQMGYDGVALLKAMVEEDDAAIAEMYPDHAHEGDRDIYRTGLRVVVPNEDSPIKKELFEETTEYMLLPAFQEWLGQYGLTSS